MSALSAYVDGISVIGPGCADWPATEAVLAGRADYRPSPTVLSPVLALPAAERRRTGRIVKLAIATGLEAAGRAAADPASLPAVFSSSGGDGDNCHEICQTLATSDQQLSPTRFHNSVHNAPAGYWSIATGAMAASTSLCAFDASFAAGLLEALAQVVALGRPTLLIACDAPYPSPLHETRPIPDAFGTALVLAPARGEQSLLRLTVGLDEQRADRMTEPRLESLRAGVPAARSLPLLALIARRAAGSVNVEYLAPVTLRIDVEPC